MWSGLFSWTIRMRQRIVAMNVKRYQKKKPKWAWRNYLTEEEAEILKESRRCQSQLETSQQGTGSKQRNSESQIRSANQVTSNPEPNKKIIAKPRKDAA